MKYRRIGTTTLELSEIGFGCGGNAGLMTRGTLPEQTSAVARALELGINYFDNSPDYGDGIAESNLGRVLKELKHIPVLNSKVEIRAANLADIAGHVVRSTEDSLKRLGVDCLDILQVHNGPTAVPPKLEGANYKRLWIEDYLEPGGAVDGLLRLKRDGKVRHLGFICRGADGDEVKLLLDTGMFSLINVPYTLLNPSAGRAMPDGLHGIPDFGNAISEAATHGAGAAIYSPLAGGALTDATLENAPRHRLARKIDSGSPQARDNAMRAAAVAFLAQENGLSLAQAGVRFILDHPAVTTVLGGFSSQAQIEEIVAAADAPGFSTQQMARLEAVWRNNFGL